MTDEQKQKASGMLTALKNGITKDEIDTKILDIQGDVLGKAKRKLSNFFEEFILLFNLLKDYRSGHYTNIPWKFIASVAGAIIYFFMPIDAIPDFIPVAGYFDDASIMGLVLSMFKIDIETYKRWKEDRNEPIMIGNVNEYSDPDDEKFDLLEKNKTTFCEILTYEDMISGLISKRPLDKRIVKAAVLRTNYNEQEIIICTYMDAEGNYIWGNDNKCPNGWIIRASKIDDELKEAFSEEDMIVFE